MRRWKQAEELGFDVLWNCDAINDPDFPRVPFFEATSILTAMAIDTSTIRVDAGEQPDLPQPRRGPQRRP